ncbi:hypothetical protein C7I55_09345 [Sphingomonas deserti]|uniref:Uncharacterized protein n=1 Tax=Allosphingosinicella deserti TaxID=2116704 RepID=A0A2P7QRE6_9SPHN|nr:hypothetical protein C7I55_09345 [Sphingomonas deserti]
MHLASPAVVLTYNGLHSGPHFSKVAADQGGVIVKTFEVDLGRASQALSLSGVEPALELRVNSGLRRRTGPCSDPIPISVQPLGVVARRVHRLLDDVRSDVTLLQFGKRLRHRV